MKYQTERAKGRGTTVEHSSPSADSGLYQLVIRLRGKHVIDVGHLGRFAFPAGYYVYTGSARRSLEARIARHLRMKKRLRWHIDYLLGQARVVEVKRHHGGRLSECELNRQLPGRDAVAPGFGSSDCRCSTHLFRFQRNPNRELHSTLRFAGEGVFRIRQRVGFGRAHPRQLSIHNSVSDCYR
ncbi:MAG: GIY-YIG nuclease family protein [Nitrososphaerota archaeon]|nr:GIY-YIG nuclease family protein [Nitrososphaerota archaeon]